MKRREIIQQIHKELEIDEKEISDIINLQDKALVEHFKNGTEMFRLVYLGKFSKIKKDGRKKSNASD